MTKEGINSPPTVQSMPSRASQKLPDVALPTVIPTKVATLIENGPGVDSAIATKSIICAAVSQPLFDNGFGNEGKHGVAAADRKQPYFEEAEKQIEKYHFSPSSSFGAGASPFTGLSSRLRLKYPQIMPNMAGSQDYIHDVYRYDIKYRKHGKHK